MIAGAPNFTLDEFREKSHRPLLPSEISRATAHAKILQSARDATNRVYPREDGRDWIIRVGSYLRPGDGSNHQDGAAVDWNVVDPVTRKRSPRLTKWARDWLAMPPQRDQFSRVLLEDDHVHHVLADMDSFRAGRDPLVLDQTGVDEEGKPVFTAAIIPGVDNSLTLSVAVLVGVLAWVFFRGTV